VSGTTRNAPKAMHVNFVLLIIDRSITNDKHHGPKSKLFVRYGRRGCDENISTT
jgi:hypothetical protein